MAATAGTARDSTSARWESAGEKGEMPALLALIRRAGVEDPESDADGDPDGGEDRKEIARAQVHPPTMSRFIPFRNGRPRTRLLYTGCARQARGGIGEGLEHDSRQRLLPSTNTRFTPARSTASRQRTFTAAILAPPGPVPVAKGAHPQSGQ